MICKKKQHDHVRKYCTGCGRKKYATHMREVYYKLLKKHAWHCLKCLSTISDNLHFVNDQKNKYLVEFFAGSKTVSSVAENEFQYHTCSVDIEQKFSPSICSDLMKLPLNKIPDRNKVFAVWASVPCTVYSILNVENHWQKIVYNHRQYYYVPKTDAARSAIQLLEKTLWLIKKINPVYYFIENPRGALRHMPQINFAPHLYTISYNDFGSDVYKPTDIFTNCNFLKLPKLKTSVGRTFPGSVAKMNSAYDRSVVPPSLAREIFKQIEYKHFTQS